MCVYSFPMHRDWSCVSYFSSDLCRFRSSVTALKSAFTIRCCGCTGLLQAFALRFSRSLVLSPSILFPRVTIFTLVQLLSGLPFYSSLSKRYSMYMKKAYTRACTWNVYFCAYKTLRAKRELLIFEKIVRFALCLVHLRSHG